MSLKNSFRATGNYLKSKQHKGCLKSHKEAYYGISFLDTFLFIYSYNTA